MQSKVRSDGGLTLETLASLSYHGGRLTLIKLECKVVTLVGDEFQSGEIAYTLLFQGYALIMLIFSKLRSKSCNCLHFFTAGES